MLFVECTATAAIWHIRRYDFGNFDDLVTDEDHAPDCKVLALYSGAYVTPMVFEHSRWEKVKECVGGFRKGSLS